MSRIPLSCFRKRILFLMVWTFLFGFPHLLVVKAEDSMFGFPMLTLAKSEDALFEGSSIISSSPFFVLQRTALL